MQFTNILKHIPRRGLDPGQEKSLERVFDISERFHREAGIQVPVMGEVTRETMVIEAAHQPNFFPYSGTWKKAFLADYVSRKTPDSICVFGFADYNLSTAQLLYQNRVPAVKKISVESVGFRIPEKDRRKSFNLIAKPSEEAFEKELERIKRHYGSDTGFVEDIMRDSYSRAGNLADMNAYIFSKICVALGIKTHFFRYSDAQKEGIFLPEWQRMMSQDNTYKEAYNRAVPAKGITDMHPLEKDHAPFWYECSCGGKTPLRYEGEAVAGTCPICGRDNGFPLKRIPEEFPKLSATAVLRNILYSEGLGTSVYVSGAGGGLRYGQIAEEVSREMGLKIPATLAWKGKDLYMGKIHGAMAREIKRLTGAKSLADPDEYGRRVTEKMSELSAGTGSDARDSKSCGGQMTNLRNRLSIAKEIFSLRPSFLDELVSVDVREISKAWDAALSRAEAKQEGNVFIIEKDVVYGADTGSVYKNLGGIIDVQ